MNLKAIALDAFRAGIKAADPAAAVKAAIRVREDEVGFLCDPLQSNSRVRSGNWKKIHIIAFGKAAVPMAQSAVECLPERLLAEKPLVITSYENVRENNRLNIFGAAHPLPDQYGLEAAQKLLKRVQNSDTGELVLALISGGASALLPLPVQGVSLADKILTTEVLLGCGADINEINCVRKHLSQIKGGQLARHCSPADLQALILSDVLGDDLSSIASGPTAPDETTFSDAIEILSRYRCLEQLPVNAKNWLTAGCKDTAKETPNSNDPCFLQVQNSLIGSNAISLQAVHRHLENEGFEVIVFSTCLVGEAQVAARQVLQQAIRSHSDRPLALIAGGETTVTIRGTGKGGRNQEMALTLAVLNEETPLSGSWVFLSGGTDGIDGPTDAAGAMIDNHTLEKIRNAGVNPKVSLHNNDAYYALKAVDNLVITGATGTNVADLQILLQA